MLRKRTAIWLCTIPVLLLAFWLGARSLDTRPVWSDELRSIHDAGGDPDGPLVNGIWAGVAQRNPKHAPGYFYALNAWATFTGWHPASLRALSLMFGLLAIAITARIATELLSSWAGLFAAAVLATSAYYVHYLFEMRVYSLMSLMAALTVWLYLRIVNARKPPSRLLWLALLAAITGTLYSHYLAGFPLIAIGIYHLLLVQKNRRWPWSWRTPGADMPQGRAATRIWFQVIAIFVLAGVLFLPWLSVFVTGFQRFDTSDATRLDALSPLQTVAQFFNMFSSGASLLPIALLIIGITGLRRRGPRQIFSIAWVALAALIVANVMVGFLVTPRLRYLMSLWPPFALAVTVGWLQLRRWPALMAVVLVLTIAIGVRQSLNPAFTARLGGSSYDYPVHRVAEIVHTHLQEGDLVISALPDSYRNQIRFYQQAARYYYAQDKIRVVASDEKERQLVGQESLRAEMEQQRRLWISYSGHPPKTLSKLLDTLGSSFHHCLSLTDHPEVTVDLYVKVGLECPSSL